MGAAGKDLRVAANNRIVKKSKLQHGRKGDRSAAASGTGSDKNNARDEGEKPAEVPGGGPAGRANELPDGSAEVKTKKKRRRRRKKRTNSVSESHEVADDAETEERDTDRESDAFTDAESNHKEDSKPAAPAWGAPSNVKPRTRQDAKSTTEAANGDMGGGSDTGTKYKTK